MHWTEDFFVDHGDFYKKTLEFLRDRAEYQTDALIKLFNQYGVPEDGLILDHCCGIGRHSVLLAEKGYQVVGVDFSPVFIKRAREIAEELGVQDRCSFNVGDVRKLDEALNGERFNAVINMFTSLGYYDDPTEILILGKIREVTKPDGILIIDAANRERMIKNFAPAYIEEYEENQVYLVKNHLNLEKSILEKEWTVYEKDGDDLRQINKTFIKQRILSLHEQIRFLREAGWTYLDVYADFDLGPFSLNAGHMITVSKNG